MQFHGLVEVNPKKGDESVAANLALDPGKSMICAVLDDQGKPLSGVFVCGMTGAFHWQTEPLKGAEFTVMGLLPGKTRRVIVVHPGRGLSAMVEVSDDTKAPLTIRLQPAGTLLGRLLKKDGQAWPNVALASTVVPLPAGTVSAEDGSEQGAIPSLRTDEKGRFRIQGLIPGLKYNFAVDDGSLMAKPFVTNVVLARGEERDLGDIPAADE